MAENWGGLNNALTAFRNGINRLFPKRSTKSDGARADKNHSSSSQHQEDSDGTVDAFDCDNNFENSNKPNGSDREREILEALKKDFEADSRSHLWISHRKIAQDDRENWKEFSYGGSSPHDEHTHFEANQAKEDDGREWKFPNTEALLRKWDDEMSMELSDEYTVSNGAATAMGKPEGFKVTVKSGFDYMLLHGGRAIGEQHEATSASLKALEEDVAALTSRLAAVASQAASNGSALSAVSSTLVEVRAQNAGLVTALEALAARLPGPSE